MLIMMMMTISMIAVFFSISLLNMYARKQRSCAHLTLNNLKPNNYRRRCVTYLTLYLLTCTLRIRVLLEKLTGSQLVKKFPTFYGNPQVSLQHPQTLCYLKYFRTLHIKLVGTLMFHLNTHFHIKSTPNISLVLHSKHD